MAILLIALFGGTSIGIILSFTILNTGSKASETNMLGNKKMGEKWNVTKYDKKGNFVGDWKDGEHLNGVLYDKFGKFIGKYVNGELH